MKYACIAAQRDSFDVTLMCGALGVSRAGFYAACARQREPLGARARANEQLLVAIRAEHTASRKRYGAPRIHRAVCDHGLRCGRHRVARLMRQDGLRGRCRRKFRVTTESDHSQPIAANLVDRSFAPRAIGERDRVWAADITYLWTLEGWLYLAVVLDLASRRVIGWCADRTLDHSLAVRAVTHAFLLRRPRAGLIHHSDRGVQYASAPYQAVLAAHHAIPSMSRRGDCWDNAVVESFFATLKTELAPRRWATRDAAQRALTAYIDVWYNHQRRHSALGYRSPVDYERGLAQRRSA